MALTNDDLLVVQSNNDGELYKVSVRNVNANVDLSDYAKLTDLSDYAKLTDEVQVITAKDFVGNGSQLTGVVTSLTAGTGLEITPSSTGDVTINATYNPLEFGGTVDITTNVIPGQVRAIQQLYVNTGEGAVSAAWAAVINNATTATEANPGDFVVKDLGSTEPDPWSLVPAGSPPAVDGLWVDDGQGDLYPITLTNKVGIGTATPTSKLTVRSDLENGVKKMLTLEGASPVPIEEGEPGAGAELFMTAHFGESRAGVIGVENVSGSPNQSHDMYFSTSNTSDPEERMRITYDGKVGIGTTDPQAELDVNGEINAAVGLSLAGNSGGIYKRGSSSKSISINADPDNIGTNSKIIFNIDNDEKMRINTDGYVGIGTEEPSHKLVLASDGDSAETFLSFGNTNTAAGLKIGTTDGNLDWDISATNSRTLSLSTNQVKRLLVAADGKVGIGTTLPSEKLHIYSETNISHVVLESKNSTIGTDTVALTLKNNNNRASSINSVDENDNLIWKIGRSYVGGNPTVNLDFTVGSILAQSILPNGNVGIGTPTPARKLEIVTGTGIAGFKQSSSPLATTLEFLRDGASTITNNAVEVNTTDGNVAAINYSGGAYFANDVGIGTTNPSYLLSLSKSGTVGSISTYRQFNIINKDGTGTQSFIGCCQPSASLPNTLIVENFSASGTNGPISLNPDGGNVGIGTTDPGARLHVQGSAANSLIAKFGANHSVPERALELNEFEVSGTNSTGFQFNAPGVSNTGAGAAISLATIGVDRLYVDYLGNVGIGTTDPQYTLDVAGEIRTGAWDRSKENVEGVSINQYGRISCQKQADGTVFEGYLNKTETFKVGSKGNAYFADKVGIGTTDPQVKLDVSNSSGDVDIFLRGQYYRQQWKFTSSDDGSNGLLTIANNSSDTLTPRVVIKDVGNVGIGTTDPAHKLDVAGDLRADNYRIDLLDTLPTP